MLLENGPDIIVKLKLLQSNLDGSNTDGSNTDGSFTMAPMAGLPWLIRACF